MKISDSVNDEIKDKNAPTNKYPNKAHLAIPAPENAPEILDFESAFLDQLNRQVFGKKRTAKVLAKRREILAATQADNSPYSKARNGKHFIYSLLETVESDKGSYIVLSSIGDENPQVALKAYTEDSLVLLRQLLDEVCVLLAEKADKKGKDIEE